MKNQARSFDDEVNRLWAELAQTKQECLQRCRAIEASIESLQYGQGGEPAQREPPTSQITNTTGRQDLPLQTDAPPSTAVTDLELPAATSAPAPSSSRPSSPTPSFVQNGLDAVVETLGGPLAVPVDLIRSAYARARKEDRVAIFFLTVLGVITSLTGAGYLLKYSFANLLVPAMKVALSEAIALLVVLIGSRLWKKEPFRQFASALIGLGVAMSYLVVYFATTAYGILAPTWSLGALALTTCVAYWLARVHETKIVATVMLFGGSLTPYLVDNEVALNSVYQGLLLLLSVASLRLAKQVSWPALGKYTFVVAATGLEFAAFARIETETPSSFVELGLILAFHTLFAGWLLSDGRRLRERLPVHGGWLLCANVGVLATTLWSAAGSPTLLATLLASSALAYAMLGVGRKARAPALAGGLLALAGALGGLAFVVIAHLDTLGLVLALEGLLLVALGVHWNLTTLRREGYVITLGACWVSLKVWVTAEAPVSLWSTPYLNLLTLGVTLVGLQRLTRRDATASNTRPDPIDTWARRGFGEATGLWIAGTCMWTLVRLLPLYGWHGVVAPVALLLWRAERNQLPITRIMGFSLTAVLLVPITQSMTIVNSIRFTSQLTHAQYAILEALAVLWVGPIFMRYISPTSPTIANLRRVQLGVYLLLPVVWVPSAARRFPESQLLLLWTSTVIAGALASYTRARSLRFESWALFLLAWGLTSAASLRGSFSLNQQATAWAVGAAVQALVIVTTKGYSRSGSTHWLAAPVLKVSVLYCGALLAVGVSWFGASASACAWVAGAYFVSVPRLHSRYAPLRSMLRPMTRLGQALLLVSVAAAGWFPVENVASLWVVVSALTFAVVTYGKTREGRLILASAHAKRENVWLIELTFSHMLFFTAYFAALASFTHSAIGIELTVAMVIHGIAMLAQLLRPQFVKLRSLTLVVFLIALVKLVLVDLRFASTLQKMLAFILLGGLSLGAAYVFQRLARSRPDRGDS